MVDFRTNQVMKLTGLGKSQVNNYIRKKRLKTNATEEGDRHIIPASSLMVFLAYLQKQHQEKADKMRKAYAVVERMVSHG